ncbi:hypothetical protein PHLCEN_2v9432 [Hermanssonia centrifuga]|uniref:Uncharacterized protein n=1 Tax=Hermanssonia centrifuga TaxID=98765 RepID=A0A2R6NQT4_9APHY|nr:hypothetical protein PHLCEN_2v9432 [Hermanssonia centrifuga]
MSIDLFLIRPPEGASHRPVRPEHIVVAGDSAGGGLTIALLQVIRDCGLPPPAGGDVIPPYGLSFYKPSTLWPPPPDDLTSTVRETLRSRIRHAVSLSAPTGSKGRGHNRSESRSRPVTPLEGGHDLRLPRTGQTLRLGSTASLPTIQAGIRDQTVSCSTASGETLTIHEQIHLYTPNYMLHHPLISPIVSYLGGLPPLLIIAGDAEVLRDEIVYFAHKAANPDKYPVKQEARDMYPALEGIEKRFAPTSVHLQVYDDAAHILPILFSFTTPAKYCFRAIATFIRFVTGTLPASVSDPVEITSLPITQSPPSTPGGFSGTSVSQGSNERLPRPSSLPRTQSSPASREASPRPRRASLFIRANKNKVPDEENGPAAPTAHRKSFRRAISSHISRTGLFRNQSVSETARENAEPEINGGQTSSGSATPPQEDSADVGGPRFHGYDWSQNDGVDVRRAGEPSAYRNGIGTMIRERISTHGVIRPLEPESELSAFSLPPEIMGQVSELAMRRYQDARLKFDKKFSGTYKTIEKHRRKNIETAKKDAVRNMTQLQNYIAQDEKPSDETFRGVKDGLFAGGSWSWAWALDTDERPPPSSIVARRDTHEAVELARIADQAVLVEENMMSGNNLWSLMVNFLTVSPDKHHQSHHPPAPQDRESKRERIRSRFAHLVSELKKKPVPSDSEDINLGRKRV